MDAKNKRFNVEKKSGIESLEAKDDKVKDAERTEGNPLKTVGKIISNIKQVILGPLDNSKEIEEATMKGHQTNIENFGEKIKDPETTESERLYYAKASQEEADKMDEVNADYQARNTEVLNKILDIIKESGERLLTIAAIVFGFSYLTSDDKGESDTPEIEDKKNEGGEE